MTGASVNNSRSAWPPYHSVVLLLFAAAFISYIDRTNISVAAIASVATLPGIIGVYITGWLVDRTGTYVAPFLLTAGISLFGAVFYLVFGSG